MDINDVVTNDRYSKDLDIWIRSADGDVITETYSVITLFILLNYLLWKTFEDILVRELTFETLPPPPEQPMELIFVLLSREEVACNLGV